MISWQMSDTLIHIRISNLQTHVLNRDGDIDARVTDSSLKGCSTQQLLKLLNSVMNDSLSSRYQVR